MNEINIDKEYKTRGGHKVKILYTDMIGNYPVVAAVFRDDGAWSTHSYTLGGRLSIYRETDLDLIEIEEGVWVGVFQAVQDTLTYTRNTEQEIEEVLKYVPASYSLIGKHFFPFPKKGNL